MAHSPDLYAFSAAAIMAAAILPSAAALESTCSGQKI